MKIVLCSDNHSNLDVIKKIASLNNDADYYWHLGDSESFDALNELKPFIGVRGNNDCDLNLPKIKIVSIDNFHFLLVHGHEQIRGNYMGLYNLAIEKNCNVVLYGHTHLFDDFDYNGIRFINPGSCLYNRNGEGPTYALINTDGKSLKLIKKHI